MLRGLTLFIAASVALAPLLPTLGASRPASCQPGFAFEGEDVRIWFHGKKGFVKVYGSDDDGDHLYAYKTGEIVEFDSSGVEVAKMHLGRAYPQTSTCVRSEDENFVNMSITITDVVRALGSKAGHAKGPQSSTLGDATVTFAYHFEKATSAAKFDLIVQSWPWRATGQLAYRFDVMTEGLAIVEAENGLGFINATGVPKGSIEWDDEATARYDATPDETASVASDVQIDDTHAVVTLTFEGVTPGYSELEYDPWLWAGPWLIVGGRLVALPSLSLAPRVPQGLAW